MTSLAQTLYLLNHLWYGYTDICQYFYHIY